MLTLSELVIPLAKTVQACPGGSCAYRSDGNPGWLGMPMMGWGGGYSLGIIGPIMSLILWVAIIAAVIYLFRHFAGGYPVHRGEDANEIIKKRFAKGEITREDYDRMKKELEKM